MPYVSFSLKYRPRRFDDVVGQQHVAQTLKNALAHDRVAHAYLFTGPRGTGKTSTARILAAALNCVDGPTAQPCGQCDMCRAIILGNAMDVIEIDAASNTGVDHIRDLREKVKFAPAQGRYKVYVLDEAHMLSTGAVNALLKTLEEPPEHVVFLLLTTEVHKIIPTILSRCQHFEFRAITLADIVASLRRLADQEQIEVEDAALMSIAQAADGAMRDAQSIFDQVVAYADGPISIALVNEVLGVTDHTLLSNITDQIIAGDIAACFASVDQAISEGKDLVRLVEHLTVYLRDLLRLQVVGDSARGLSTSAEPTADMRGQAQSLGAPRLVQAVQALAELQSQLKRSSQHALLVELALAQLCVPPQPNQVTQPTQATAAQAPPSRPAAKSAPSASRPAAPKRDQPVRREATTPPAPPPAQPVVAQDQQLNLPTLVSHWPLMYDELKRMGHMPIGAILRDACPIAVEGDVITIGFSSQFHSGRIENEYKSIVEQAATRLYARPLRIVCKLFSDADELRAVAEAAQAECPLPSENDAAQAETTEDVATQEPPSEPQPPTEDAAATDHPHPEQPEAGADEQELLTPDQVVERTLSLFNGSTEIADREDHKQDPQGE